MASRAQRKHSGGRDAIEVLTRDHRTVEQLFAAFEGTSSSQERRELVDEMIRELSVHAAIEEAVLYPAVRDEIEDGEEVVEHSLDEHQAVKDLLAEIDDLSAEDPDFVPTAESLMRDVRLHVDEEEGELFERMRLEMDPDRLADLGDALDKARVAAPTRPHPMAHGMPPGNIAADMAAAGIDRARDVGRKAVRAGRRMMQAARPPEGREGAEEDLERMSKDDLLGLARRRNIPGRSRMGRTELLRALRKSA